MLPSDPLARSTHSEFSSVCSTSARIVQLGEKSTGLENLAPSDDDIVASAWCGSSVKRLFDVVASGLALVPLFPVFFCIGALVRYDSDGPAIFRQKRVGQHGLPFTILKFRTMRQGALGSSRTSHGDSRLTQVGKFLRRYKLDELPQLVNVLRGEMSFVGPRPKLHGHNLANFSYRPGITGAATLAFAGEERLLLAVPEKHLELFHQRLICPKKLELDREYMFRATFSSDLLIIIKTLLRRGRYASLSELGIWNITQPTQMEAVSGTLVNWKSYNALKHQNPLANGTVNELAKQVP